MRHPRTFKVLAWAGPAVFVFCGSCIGLLAALAQAFPDVRTWAQDQFHHWWPIVTAPWILISAAVVILMYVVALAYTSTNAGSQPPPIGAFGLDDHMGDTGSADPLPAKWTTDNFEDEFNYHARKKPIERDTPLGEAFGYMALREWGHDTDRALMELCEQRAPNIFSQFRQRAFDGEITVWGRRHRHDIYVPIEPRYWHTHQIDGGALLNGLTRTWGQDGESYIDLMVSRAQIERAWK